VFAVDHRQQTLRVIDVETGKESKYTAADFPQLTRFSAPAVSPRGQYLFLADAGAIHRFKVKALKLSHEERGPKIAECENVEFSLVVPFCALPGQNGTRTGMKVHPAAKAACPYLYDPDKLDRPVLTLEQGPSPRAVGFDPAVDRFYAHSDEHQLIVFDDKGAR